MEKIFFSKMSGAGNDFIVIDKNLNPGFVLSNIIIKKLCNRKNGIGADGLITIENSEELDFIMSYYNADGSTGSLCGNGSRCAIYFAELSGRIKNKVTSFFSNGVKYSGEVLGTEKIKFFLNQPVDFRQNLELHIQNNVINASFINTGSPHVIVDISDLKNMAENKSGYSTLEELPVFNLGREIRYLKDFQPGGANVNFIQRHEEKINIRTYERGVEDETLACGTGSVASALIGYFIHHMQPPITISTFGGDDLIVNFNNENQTLKDLSLTGPAKIIYTGDFLLNKFI